MLSCTLNRMSYQQKEAFCIKLGGEREEMFHPTKRLSVVYKTLEIKLDEIPVESLPTFQPCATLSPVSAVGSTCGCRRRRARAPRTCAGSAVGGRECVATGGREPAGHARAPAALLALHAGKRRMRAAFMLGLHPGKGRMWEDRDRWDLRKY